MDILVIALALEDKLPQPSAELIGGARDLVSNLGGTVSVAILGKATATAGKDAAEYGSDRIYTAQDATLADYDAEAFLRALEAVMRSASPSLVLFPADAFTTELAPRLAHRLDSGSVTNCAAIESEPSGELVFVRPVYGGKAMAEVVVTGGRAVVTMAPGTFRAPARDDSHESEVVPVEVPAASAPAVVRTLEVKPEETAGVRLEDAKVIVSGGRGLGEPGNFRYVEELAKVLNGAVGASRPAVDGGWVSPSIQVGQTGKTVAPDLYIAVGISGASQHLAGMSKSRHVVVINKDPEAPFFKAAEVGVVADYRRILPLLVEKLKAKQGSG